jgi:esterase/lipase
MSTLKKTTTREINSDFENEVYYVLENYSDNARDYKHHNNFIWYFDELDYILSDMTDKYSNNKGIQNVINLYNECFTELMFKNVEKIKEGSITVQKWIDEIVDLQSCMNVWLEKDSKTRNYEKCNIFFESESE